MSEYAQTEEGREAIARIAENVFSGQWLGAVAAGSGFVSGLVGYAGGRKHEAHKQSKRNGTHGRNDQVREEHQRERTSAAGTSGSDKGC